MIIKGGVYQIQCIKNDRVYFGRSKNVYARICAHKSALHYGNHDCVKMQEDFNKYNEDGFVFSIITLTDSIKKQSSIERKMMKKNRERIYNSLIEKNKTLGSYVYIRLGKDVKNKLEELAFADGSNMTVYVRQLVMRELAAKSI